MAEKETNTPKKQAKVDNTVQEPEKVKKEKPAKAAKTKGDGGSAFKAKVAAIVRTDNFKIFGIIAISLLLVLVLSLSVVFGAMSCNPISDELGGDLSDGLGYTPVDAENYDYDRFDDDKNFDKVGTAVDANWDGVKSTAITEGYEKGTALAQQTSTYGRTLDKSEIVKPVAGVRDEHVTYGVKEYPSYGKVLKGYTVEERNGLIRESHAIAPSPTWKSLGIYNAIDKDGYLLKNGQKVPYSSNITSGGDDETEEGEIISGGIDEEGGEQLGTGSSSASSQYQGSDGYRMLYKHSAAEAHFGGGLSDDEPRIVKSITAKTHTKLESTQITGLYAPAGEVIKVEMTESDYRAAGGLRVLIGQNYNLYQHVSMETSGNGIKGNGLCRMPDILSIFQYDDKNGGVTIKDGKAIFYVGSFIGGPIYFRPMKNTTQQTITVTFTGAVRYQHFILGATTKAEYEENAKSTAPYFDLEVYDSVRFTSARIAALKNMTYENCTDGAILWDKIAEVSTRVAANGLSGASAPVYIIGDCYIAAGAAFANPGRNGVVCPPSWLAEALNYNRFVNSGSWGTMHEYNHCWQGYGCGNGGEVTNNATTLVSYSLYTRISRGRTSATGWGNGSWNRYTDPSKSLATLLQQSSTGNKCFDLPLYATLIHNIGQDKYVAAARGGREAGSHVYYNNLVNATHYDMTYYFTDILNNNIAETGGKGTLVQSKVDEVKSKNYPVFVPVSSVYQVGRSIIYDNEKQYITTAQPFTYGTGEFVMDFNNRNNFKEGQFVSKSLVIPDGITAKVVSVTQPENGTVELLEDNYVKYTPKSGKDGLYSGNFRVTLRLVKDDLRFIIEDVDLVINLKQSSGTFNSSSLNRTTYAYSDAAKVPSTDAVYNAETKTFDFGEYSSTETIKNVCSQETNTQIWGSGRNYLDDTWIEGSSNYKEFEVGKTIQTLDGVMYFSSAGTYRFTLKGRGKATLYLSYDGGTTWDKALTIDRKSGNAYVNTEYFEHKFTTAENYVHFKVVLHVKNNWQDFFGIGTATMNANGSYPDFTNAAAISSVDIEPHKQLMEFNKEVDKESASKFKSDYYFKNEYKYSYSNNNTVYAAGQTLISCNREAWDATQQISNLFDGNVNTYYLSASGAANYITEEKPFELVVDMNSIKTVSRVTFNGYKGNVGNNGMVKTFKIYGSIDGTDDGDWFLVTEQTDSPANNKTMVFDFDTVAMRYYKLVVTDTDNHHYFGMKSIVFSNPVSFPNGKLIAPNDFNVRYIGDSWGAGNELCSFGLVYTANAGDSVECHFTGTRFAYLAYLSSEYGTVDIYVDNKVVAENVSLAADNYAGGTSAAYDHFNVVYSGGTLAYLYTGDALEKGEHTVKIVGKSGTFNLDCFAYWD